MTVEWTGAWLKMTRNYLEVEQLLGEGWVVCRHTCAWQPPTDVYENDEGLVVQVEVAGMRSEDFSISLTGRTLVIAGTRTDAAAKQTYHQMEIRFGEFRTEVYLPWPVEPEDVEASYEEGFLKVHLPRPRAQRVPVVEAEWEED
nr:Hsp20/alpha crystallin family protein [Anaerolineae bacterium]